MAQDLERLVVQLSADIKKFENAMNRAQGITNKRAREIESRFEKLNKSFANVGASVSSLTAPLTGVVAAIGTREILAYADAWTSAKNSLAVAGVTGDAQVQVLDKLYQSAQKNAVPIGAMTDLYGKASQAQVELGASTQDLTKFTDGVGVALKVAGTNSTAASGSLLQLGQLLGSGTVHAEEFNSVMEGARPILIAVANGLEDAGGSVARLKQLVVDGKVSSQQFFAAFLKGLPTIESMAANATQTIDQGMTKVNNAFTKYIGETDKSLGASQRLVAGLNALADNFNGTADIVLKLAAVIAGALVGRSIVGMISNLKLATSAVVQLVAALRTASSAAGVASAIGSIGAAAGPVGAIIGGTVVGALALFATSTGPAGEAANRFADRLDRVGKAAEESAKKVDGARESYSAVKENQLAQESKVAAAALASTTSEAVNLLSYFAQMRESNLITAEQEAELNRLRDGIQNGTVSADDARQSLAKMATADYNFQQISDALSPLLSKLANISTAAKQTQADLAAVQAGQVLSPEQAAGYKQYAASRSQGEQMLALGKAYSDEALRQNTLSKEQLAIEKETAKIKADLAKKGGYLPDDQIKTLATANVKADQARTKEGKKTPAEPKTADSRFKTDLQEIRDRTAALVQEQQITGQTFVQQEKRRMALDLEQQALKDVREEARKNHDKNWESVQLAPEQIAEIQKVSAAYAEQADILRQVQEQQDRAESSAKEFYDTAKSGFADVITGASSLQDALSGLAKKLADLALNSAFDAVFGGTKTTSSGGALTGIFKALGFADGGYTGAGSKYEPAGVVHKGEYVMDAATVRKAGGPAAMDAMRRGLKGYANGGYVGPSAPRLPDISKATGKASAPVQINYNPVVDARGADAAAVSRLEQALAQDRKMFKLNVISSMRDAKARGVKV